MVSVFHVFVGLLYLLKLNVLGKWLLREKVNWQLGDYERMMGNPATQQFVAVYDRILY